MNITDRWLRNLKPPATGRAEYHDANVKGLSLRVTSKGAMTWAIYYRLPDDRTKRRLTLGQYPAISLAEARKQSKTALLEAVRGKDPGKAKQEAKAAPTFATLAAEYLERYASQKKSGGEDRRMLERDVLTFWGKRKAHDIQRRDVIALLDCIVDRGAPIQANRVLALIRKIFNWGINRDLVRANPCAQVKAPGKENQKDRTLTSDEIATVWRGLETAALSDEIRLALRFILVTGQRPGEVISAEWSEFDLAGGWWSIPAAKAKNGLGHRVPLPPLGLDLLAVIGNQAGESPFLFPSPRQGQPIHINALAHALRRNRDILGIEPFTPHDLRRTAASHMTSMGISRLVVSKILNHVERGVTAIYDRHSYDDEKRMALDAWGRRLHGIITGETLNNVVSIKGTG